MALTVEWTDLAERRLREIFDYYNAVAGMKTARKIISKIYARTLILTGSPEVGQREELIDKPEGFRYLVEGNYKIIYYVTGEKVIVATVFDCRRNPVNLPGEVSR